MKLNKILMALAAMAMVGCSSEDFNDFTANQAIDEAGLIQLDDNFVLAGVGEEGDVTRTHWEKLADGGYTNKFLPIYGATAPDGGTLDTYAKLDEQAVGLCWLGQGAVGTDVYTNYEFYHFGWLNNGAKNPEFECNVLTNGALYNEITATTGTANAEATTADWGATGLPAKSKVGGVDNLDYNSGIYKTDNKAIFGGQYIVYYPYNQDFKNAGTIPAKAETKFDPVSEDYNTAAIGKATYRYSAPVTIEGGSQASNFNLKNLSAIAQLRVAGPTWVEIGKNIDQIVLYSPSQKLLKQANLAADKIAAGSEGEALYTETEGTKTIVANFATAVPVHKENGTDDGGDKPIAAYITVLPTTVDDLVAFVHSDDGKWATVNLGNTVFIAGKAQRVDIPVTASSFKNDYIAVDEVSFLQALYEANAAATTSVKTIKVIGDITLTANLDITATGGYANSTRIKITGDKIIVPEDITLTVNANVVSDIRVLGKSCCSGTNGGILEIQGGTVNNVTMEPTEANATTTELYDQYNPTVKFTTDAATVAAGKTFDAQAGNIEVRAAVKHKGNLNLAAKVSLTVFDTGDLNFMGGSVVNNGTIEVMKDGKYDMTDSDGNATATDGQRMTNNGKFIHNVDAQVGTAVQSMAQNGEYRCRVDKQIKLDDALLQWTACSVIEMVNQVDENYNLGTGASIHLLDPSFVDFKHNGKWIDYEVNAKVGKVTTFTNPANGEGNGDSKVIEVGKLSVLAGELKVDYVEGTGKRTLKVYGDMDVKATTTFVDSKLIDLKENLNVSGSATTLYYKGAKKNEDGLKVAKNITVTRGKFDAGKDAADVNALNIECANFKLKSGAKAYFGNRTEGDAKNMTVTGEISNPSGCTFDILAANQNGEGSVYAWITCTKLTVGGSFPNARPKVVAAAQ